MNAEKHSNNKEYWEHVYTTKAETEVSWFQTYPKTSIDFIDSLHLSPGANIIDIGGGDGHFVDALLDKGFQNIWVLDISAKAIEKAKARLGEKVNDVQWVVADVTSFIPPVKFDCWHDRAAFHFLTTAEQVEKYIAVATGAIKPGGYLVISTFSEQGPRKCSGLNIQQYSENSMTKRFENAFDTINCIQEDHTTPFNTVQNFLFCSFKKK